MKKIKPWLLGGLIAAAIPIIGDYLFCHRRFGRSGSGYIKD